jgi:predicted component of type VI protein secretion system
VDIILTVKSKVDESVQNVRHAVNGRLILGRGPDSAVLLEATGISREHLEVQAEDSAVFLTDLSSNGTWLNGARMTPRRRCRVGEEDFVELPGYEIRFRLVGAAAHPAVPAPQIANASASPLEPTQSATQSRSFFSSFTFLEIFLILVVLTSVALLIFYITS